jgi:hypothetical protein
VSTVGVAVVLGGLVVLLLRTSQLRLGSALVCMVFGLVLGVTPAGPSVHRALESSGSWVWGQVNSL